jgi:methionine-S-sulfoxide reductase
MPPVSWSKDMNATTYETATFAGGCFWCMQPPFDNLEGVISTEVGYTGGHVEHPTYQQISRGDTGHYEAMRVTYDPSKVSYETLLETFWHNIDPTQADGQFADRGSQYHTAIFCHDEGQQKLAEVSKSALQSSGKFNQPIATKILKAQLFYPAEDYHQNYYQKNSTHYQMYKQGSGRAGFIEKSWKPSE